MRLLLLAALLGVLAGCTKKAEEDRPKVTPLAVAPSPECASFGTTMRSLSFRTAAESIRRGVPEGCRADWGQRLDTVASSLWLQLDCSRPETKEVMTLWLATPEAARSNPETFPTPMAAGSDPTLIAFHESAMPIVRTTADEILRLGDDLGDGGCARAP